MKIYLNSGRVKKEWTDYNGHMNLAFYIHLFDAGWEVLLQKFNMGETSAKTEIPLEVSLKLMQELMEELPQQDILECHQELK